ncbi:MAG TPA: GNAT family N-acetyltransferase [Clostridia bacterium]|nr:GNAT family N-acetyltransferase [Clostridia bacterium]
MSKRNYGERARGGASWADAMWRLSAGSKNYVQGIFRRVIYKKNIVCPDLSLELSSRSFKIKRGKTVFKMRYSEVERFRQEGAFKFQDFLENLLDNLIPDDLPLFTMSFDDYDAVCNFWNKHSNITIKKESFREFLYENSKYSLICRDQEKIVGTLLCGQDGLTGYIHNLTVDENYKDKGVEERLLEACLENLRENGIKDYMVFVNPDENSFWESCGWQKKEDIVVYSK